jgi:hypothetical protein
LDQKVKTIWLMILILGVALSGMAAAASAVIVHEGTITGGSTSSATVATSTSVTSASGNLYLAAIATKAGLRAAERVKPDFFIKREINWIFCENSYHFFEKLDCKRIEKSI